MDRRGIHNIDTDKTLALVKLAVPTIPEYTNLIRDGWMIAVVLQRRGCCYHTKKVITVPSWAFQKDGPYVLHYLCHEIAHALVGLNHNHDFTWMEKLSQVCPCKECATRELGYNPRVARKAIAAGVSN